MSIEQDDWEDMNDEIYSNVMLFSKDPSQTRFFIFENDELRTLAIYSKSLHFFQNVDQLVIDEYYITFSYIGVRTGTKNTALFFHNKIDGFMIGGLKHEEDECEDFEDDRVESDKTYDGRVNVSDVFSKARVGRDDINAILAKGLTSRLDINADPKNVIDNGAGFNTDNMIKALKKINKNPD